jgi:phenylacetic acid degradation operon negative regulatory protein
MVERGELRVNDGVYELAGRVRGRASAQDWSLDPKLARWQREWRTALVVAPTRASTDRAALRDAMRQLHYAELREGVWTRPDNLPRAAGPGDAWDIADAQCAWWTGRPDGDPRELAVELFDPDAWARTADRLRVRLERDGSLADGFHAGAAALGHVRADPLLPAELGPSANAGNALRASYRQWERSFADALRAWFRTQA